MSEFWITMVYRGITVLVIPAFLYVNSSIETLKTQVELIKQQLEFQNTQLTLIVKDHEDRLRQIERTHNG